MEQLSQVVQAAGDGALVGVGVLQVLIWNVGTCQKGAFGLLQAALVHQDDSCVQVGRCEEEGKVIKTAQQGSDLLSITHLNYTSDAVKGFLGVRDDGHAIIWPK